MIFYTAYDTLACRAYNLDAIKTGIQYASLERQLLHGQQLLNQIRHPLKNVSLTEVWVVAPGNKDIPLFTHPVRHYDSTRQQEKPMIVLDGRSFLRQDKASEMRLMAPAEFRFQSIRAKFNQIWIQEPDRLRSLGDLCPLVFCRWLTQAIVKRLGLDPSQQAQTMAVVLFYWYSLFRQADDAFDDRERMAYAKRLTQISGIPQSQVSEVVENIEPIDDINGLCAALQTHIRSTRVSKLTPAFMFAALAGSWFGTNGKETVNVATEHVPTFVSIVTTALMERSYRKSQLGQLVFNYEGKGRGDLVIRNARRLLSE